MIKSELLKKFTELYPTLVSRMRNTLHSYDDNHLSPYHLEDCVWSHTMLVLKSLYLSGDDEFYSEEYCENDYASVIAAICHDIGKIHARKSHNPPKINFWGHGIPSVQYAIDFTYKLYNTGYFRSKNIKIDDIDNFIEKIIYPICYHIDAWDIEDEEEIKKIMLYNFDSIHILNNLLKADVEGRFSENEEEFKAKINRDIERESNDITPDVVVVCGIPGCGKDYVAHHFSENILGEKNPTIVSFDKLRIQKYINDIKPTSEMTPDDLYKAAFNYCSKTNMGELLKSELRRQVDLEKKPIWICNTSTTRKSREGLLKIIDSVYKTKPVVDCIYVIVPLEVASRRDKDRKKTDKSVGDPVVYKFAHSQELPTYREGFDEIGLYLNV